jgi:outer membrane protein OmpA-like peptidoglycan-associated protein
MAPAVRWIVGIVLALIAFGLWTYWGGGKWQSPAPDKAPVAQAPAAPPASTASIQPAALTTSAPAPAPAPAPAAEEPVTVALYFDFDRSGLRADEKPKLDALVAKVKGKSFKRLEAVGHADRIGEEPYNDQLSRKRAEAVVAYLALNGIDTAQLSAEGIGEHESTTGDACKDLGAESPANEKLVECLKTDRYVQITMR